MAFSAAQRRRWRRYWDRHSGSSREEWETIARNIRPGDWTTSPEGLAVLKRDGVDAWRSWVAERGGALDD
jgi:hypothetical protein